MAPRHGIITRQVRHPHTAHHRAIRRPSMAGLAVPAIVLSLLVPALIVGPLGYWLAREHSLSAVNERLAHEANIAALLITPPGTAIVASGDTLMLASSAQRSPLSLSNLNELDAATGDTLTLYVAQPGTMSGTPQLIAGGQPAPQVAQSGIMAECANAANCHQAWAGAVRQDGVSYEAAYMPLLDSSGTLAGALAARTPAAAIESQARLEGALLGALSALISGLAAFLGWLIFMRRSQTTMLQMDDEMRRMQAMANVIERRVANQSVVSRRHEQMAQEVVAGAQHLHRAVIALNETHSSLVRSAGSLWSSISQPGVSSDPEVQVSAARDAVMATARLGTALDDTRNACAHVLGLMNNVIAESQAQARASQETADTSALVQGKMPSRP